jgi:hypothetical protein
VLTLGYSFQAAGKALEAATGNKGRMAIAWAAGVCILVHGQNFIGISYFGQLPVVLFLNIAIVASLAQVPAVTRLRVAEPRIARHVRGQAFLGQQPAPI